MRTTVGCQWTSTRSGHVSRTLEEELHRQYVSMKDKYPSVAQGTHVIFVVRHGSGRRGRGCAEDKCGVLEIGKRARGCSCVCLRDRYIGRSLRWSLLCCGWETDLAASSAPHLPRQSTSVTCSQDALAACGLVNALARQYTVHSRGCLRNETQMAHIQ